MEHHPHACCHCGQFLQEADPDRLRHQVVEIPPLTEHRLPRLLCPCCSTSTCATLPADVEVSHSDPGLCSVGALGLCIPIEFRQNPGAARSAIGGGDQTRHHRLHSRTVGRQHGTRRELLQLQWEFFECWHQSKAGVIDWPSLRRRCEPLRLGFEQTLQRVVDLGFQRGEQMLCSKMVRTCQQLLHQKQPLWNFSGAPLPGHHQTRQKDPCDQR